VLVAVGVLLIGRRHLAHLDAEPELEPETRQDEAAVLTAADS
jgi:ACDE family multidrug resistance protein